MGKKIIYFVTRWDDASWERKSKAGRGGIKSKAAQLYTPLDVHQQPLLMYINKNR